MVHKSHSQVQQLYGMVPLSPWITNKKDQGPAKTVSDQEKESEYSKNSFKNVWYSTQTSNDKVY